MFLSHIEEQNKEINMLLPTKSSKKSIDVSIYLRQTLLKHLQTQYHWSSQRPVIIPVLKHVIDKVLQNLTRGQ